MGLGDKGDLYPPHVISRSGFPAPLSETVTPQDVKRACRWSPVAHSAETRFSASHRDEGPGSHQHSSRLSRRWQTNARPRPLLPGPSASTFLDNNAASEAGTVASARQAQQGGQGRREAGKVGHRGYLFYAGPSSLENTVKSGQQDRSR